jgi:hypothetical protein
MHISFSIIYLLHDQKLNMRDFAQSTEDDAHMYAKFGDLLL